MALTESTPQSLIAGADLTGKRHYFGKQGSAGIVVCSVAGEAAHVIIASEPTASGEAVDGWTDRRPAVLAGGTFAAGANLTTSAAGKAVEATAGQTVNAVAVEAGVDGRVVAVMRPLAIGVTGDGGYQAISASGAISPTAGRVDVSVSGTKAYTLADGTAGHEMDIVCVSAASTPLGTITIATPFDSQPATHILFAVGQRIRLRMTATGWMVIEKRRAGSLTVVVGTDVLTGHDMAETYNLSVTGTVSSTSTKALPDGLVIGELMQLRCTVAASTPVGSIDGTYKAAAGTATTHAGAVDSTADYAVAIWDGAAWLVTNTSGITFS